MKVVIHIGVHKTGTTFLQAALTRNRGSLLERGVYYRPIGNGQTSHYVIVKFRHRPGGDAEVAARRSAPDVRGSFFVPPEKDVLELVTEKECADEL